MSIILGLDFGTTTTVLSNAAGIITVFGQEQLIPSAVLHNVETGNWEFGKKAIDTGLPNQLFTNLKSAITQNRTELSTRDGTLVLDADLVITKFLQFLANELKWDQQFGSADVRMSCPAFWDKSQRMRLIRCATEAGLNVVGNVLLDEPVSAAVGWLESGDTSKSQVFGKKIMVFDMGGGTLDLALVDLGRKGLTEQEVTYQVTASCGSSIAGNAIDYSIARTIYKELGKHGVDIDLVDVNGGINYFLTAAREIKEALSTTSKVSWVIALPGSESITFTFSENELEKVLLEVFESEDYGEPVKVSIEKLFRLGFASSAANLGSISDIHKKPLQELADLVDGVLVVGGMAHMPILKNYLNQFFKNVVSGSEPLWLLQNDSLVQEVVAWGLGQSSSFININMMRPDFDILLRVYDDRLDLELGTYLIWEAYSMPYSTRFDPIRPASFLFTTKEILIPTPENYDRASVSGEVSIVSNDGTSLRLRGSNSEYGFSFRFSETSSGIIQMSSAGVFTIVDEGGRQTSGQLHVWPEPFVMIYNRNYKRDGDLGSYAD